MLVLRRRAAIKGEATRRSRFRAAIRNVFAQHRGPRSALIVGALLLSAMILGTNAITLNNLRENALRSTETNLKSQVTVLAGEVDRSFKVLDLALSIVADHVARLGASESTFKDKLRGRDIHELLKEKRAGLGHVDALALVDRYGTLVSSSRYWPMPDVNLSDRDYFEALKSKATPETFVSKPLQNKSTGAWMVFLARRLRSADGEFLGVALGAITLQYFEEFFRSIALQDGSAVALLRQDGMLMARYPRTSEVGEILPSLVEVIKRTQGKTVLRVEGPFDRRSRLASARPLANYPLRVAVSQTEDSALRDWRSHAQLSNIMAAASALLVLLISLLTAWWWRRQEKLTHEVRLQNLRFDVAMNNMSQGLCLFDAGQRVVIANRRYAEMYGLTPEQVEPGTRLSEILEARAASGIYANIDAAKFVRDGIDGFRQKVSQILRLADGRVISVLRLPMPDGSLISTHEDITEREKLDAQLAEQHEQLGAALENMLQGVAMFDAAQRLIVCNRRYAEMYGLTAEQVKPGTTVRQILEYRFANGFYHVSDKESFVASWTGHFGEVSSRIQELADGRIVNVTRCSMANGGRLVTHEDITERQKLNALLEKQHRLLKEQEEQLRLQNVRLDAALSNMLQGLAMFDAEHRIVIANDRYAQMYGLSPEQLKPGTALREILEYRIARGYCPGRSADDMLRATLRQTSGKGSAHYVTELNDGRCIAISAQTMGDGGTVTTHQDITEQRRSEAKIAHMALHDALTGLANRALLNERLEHAIARVKRGEIVATHLLDLDRFKTVNDTLGHPAGDKLLQMVAERLRALVRETDTIARMGGDEFAIVQVAISEPADATSLALRVIEALSAPYQINDHQVVIGASVGVAVGPNDGSSPEQLMRNADLALYRAKGDGRGTFRFFERDMDAQMQERHALERDLRKALPAGQFELYYQPIVDLASNDINGFETLVRWRHPERGLVPPDTFIPLAEEIGLIIPIGEWIIREACMTAAKWPEDLKIAVNLSPAQFRSPGLLQVIVSALAASGLAADRLEVEITETVLLEDGETTLNLLYQLRGLGIRIAMDDFGAGYSSLSYLQSFPFDKIKIDRSFVKDIVESTGSLNIVRAIAALAKGLGMAATAEGVETEEQLAAIKSEGCTEMQGFLFSQPRPGSEIERLFISARAIRRKRGVIAG